ncbi:MAG: trypsin-like peptidase domain-containing protein [Anaerolineales bacterium]
MPSTDAAADREFLNLDSPTAKLLFSTVRMEICGLKHGGVATAFVFSQEWEGRQAAFLVTNRHAVADAQSARLYFTRSRDDRPALGEHVRLDLNQFGRIWHAHPRPEVNLAVTPLGPILCLLQEAGKRVFTSALDHSLLPPEDSPSAVGAMEDVLLVGYPAEVQDPAHVLPTMMKGITSSPFATQFAGQPKFMLQAPLYAGMGGSPVIALRSIHQATAQGVVIGSQLMLLGVLSEVAVRQDRAPAAYLPIPLAPPSVLATSNWAPFGLAVRSWTIREAVTDLLQKLEASAPMMANGQSVSSPGCREAAG